LNRRSLAAVVAILALATAAAAWADEEGRPRIFLEKRIFAETQGGKTSFYEVHTVRKGENLWKILSRGFTLPPGATASLLEDFRRANPEIANPNLLFPGQKIVVPTRVPSPPHPAVASGRAGEHRIEKGEWLIKILGARGVTRGDMSRYLKAVQDLNPSIRDVDRIIAGRTILLPERSYFDPDGGAPESILAKADAGIGDTPAPDPEGWERVSPSGTLTQDVPPQAPQEAFAAKPEAQLVRPETPHPASAATVTGPSADRTEGDPGSPKPAYRGLLMDLVAGLGETWRDRGTLYLPVSSGGEVVVNLEEVPVVRFSTGIQALIDFRGGLASGVGALIAETWTNYRVVSMAGADGPEEMIDRVLRAAGYHSVRDGRERPLVIGEEVTVVLPARWIVLRTPESLLSGEVVLVKEVPEKPSDALAGILKYADRVGIHVLPYAADPSSLEGFVVGLDGGEGGTEDSPPLTVPPGGLSAVDFALGFLGIPGQRDERIRIGDAEEGSFQLVIQPERVFKAGGRTYAVDTGAMSPALVALVEESGYAVFPVGGKEPGTRIFARILEAAGIASEERRDVLLAGGPGEGYEVRLTGTFLKAPDLLEEKGLRETVLVRGRVHAVTRTMLESLGVGIVDGSL
jgi:hypothetical protein